MRIGPRISLACLAIAAVVGSAGWLTGLRNDAARAELEELRRRSIHELLGATEMVVALESTSAATQELLAESWRARTRDERGGPDLGRAADAVRRGLAAFGERLAASRHATETALALAEEHRDDAGYAAEREEIDAWLDVLSRELTVHRELLATFVDLAPQSPAAASDLLDLRIEPHYRDEMLPLIRSYEREAQRELNVALDMVERALGAADRTNSVATGVAIVLALLAGALLARWIGRPLAELEGAVAAVGTGHLDVRVPEGKQDEVGALARSFNRMADRLQATTVSKSFVDDVLRSMGEILIVTDRDGRIRSVNRAAEEQLGWKADELLGRELRLIVPDHATPGELMLRSSSGHLVPAVCRPTGLWDDEGRPQGQVWVAQNVEHMKRVEEALRRSLEDKEVLLREVHHRVKNNLQVISSMLRLQGRAVDDDDVRRLFAEGESRVRSMALVHEQLYRAGDLARVDFRSYLESLARNVVSSAQRPGPPIETRVAAEAANLPLDLAIACGLIVNELLANAMKHAFPDGRPGRVDVRFFREHGRGVLVVTDDGVGAAATEKPATDAGLGLRLVEALVRQIGGDLSLDPSRGSKFRVEFDLPAGA